MNTRASLSSHLLTPAGASLGQLLPEAQRQEGLRGIVYGDKLLKAQRQTERSKKWIRGLGWRQMETVSPNQNFARKLVLDSDRVPRSPHIVCAFA